MPQKNRSIRVLYLKNVEEIQIEGWRVYDSKTLRSTNPGGMVAKKAVMEVGSYEILKIGNW